MSSNKARNSDEHDLRGLATRLQLQLEYHLIQGLAVQASLDTVREIIELLDAQQSIEVLRRIEPFTELVIADDDEALARGLVEALRSQGIPCRNASARNDNEVRYGDLRLIDLIMLEQGSPKGGPSMPTIVMTGASPANARVRAQDYRAQAIVWKPINVVALAACLRPLLLEA